MNESTPPTHPKKFFFESSLKIFIFVKYLVENCMIPVILFTGSSVQMKIPYPQNKEIMLLEMIIPVDLLTTILYFCCVLYVCK